MAETRPMRDPIVMRVRARDWLAEDVIGEQAPAYIVKAFGIDRRLFRSARVTLTLDDVRIRKHPDSYQNAFIDVAGATFLQADTIANVARRAVAAHLDAVVLFDYAFLDPAARSPFFFVKEPVDA